MEKSCRTLAWFWKWTLWCVPFAWTFIFVDTHNDYMLRIPSRRGMNQLNAHTHKCKWHAASPWRSQADRLFSRRDAMRLVDSDGHDRVRHTNSLKHINTLDLRSSYGIRSTALASDSQSVRIHRRVAWRSQALELYMYYVYQVRDCVTLGLCYRSRRRTLSAVSIQ